MDKHGRFSDENGSRAEQRSHGYVHKAFGAKPSEARIDALCERTECCGCGRRRCCRGSSRRLESRSIVDVRIVMFASQESKLIIRITILKFAFAFNYPASV